MGEMMINNIRKIIGEVVGPRVIELAHAGNVNELKSLGINNATYQQLVKEVLPTNINHAISQSIYFVVDEAQLLKALNIIRHRVKQENILNNWIRKGASFEMCRNFFLQHTNRKHTKIRAFFGTDKLIVPKNAPLTEDENNEFKKYLWDISQVRKVDAYVIDDYSIKFNFELCKLWIVYKEYIKDEKDG